VFEPLLIGVYVIVGITFFVTLLLTLNWESIARGRRGIRHPNGKPGRNSGGIGGTEDHKLTDSVLVIQELITKCVIEPFYESWLEFTFEVFNISRETLRIGYRVDGTVILQGNRLYDRPVPAVPQDIRGGSKAMVTIVQPLLQDLAALIEKGSQKKDGIFLTFDFRDLRIFVEEMTNSPEQWPKGVLTLKKRRTYRVRQNSRVKGVYVWERTDAGSELEAFRSIPHKGPGRSV
jgi:hypothetical protein